MNRFVFHLFHLALFLLFALGRTWAFSVGPVGGISTQINHQGAVRVNGVPFTGTGHFLFAILDPTSGVNGWTHDGSALFVQDATPSTSLSIPVSGGLYSVRLGDPSQGMIPIPEFLFAEPNRVLRVWFDDGVNGLRRLVPDHPLTSSPYSFSAHRSDIARVAEFATSSETANRATVADMADMANLADRALTADFAADASTAAEADFAMNAGDSDTLDGLDSTDLLSQAASNVQMLNEEFVVASGESVAAGEVVSFMAGTATIKPGFAMAGPRPSVPFSVGNIFTNDSARLDDSSFVIVYRESVAGGRTIALPGQAAGDTISFGSPTTITANTTQLAKVASLSTDRIVVVYKDLNNSNWGILKIGERDGDSFQFGNGVAFNTDNVDYLALAALSEDRFVVVYEDQGIPSAGRARIGDVSGTSVSLGPEMDFSTEATFRTDVTALSPTRFIIGSMESLNNFRGYVVVGDVVGNSPSFSSPIFFNREESNYVALVAFSPDRFVVAYDTFLPDENYGAARVARIIGSHVSFGYEFRFGKPAPVRLTGARLDSDHFVLTAKRTDITFNQDSGEWFLGRLTDRNIDFVAEGIFHATDTSTAYVEALSPNRFVASFNGQFTPGEVALVQVEPERIVGVAREGGMAGETVSVTLFTNGAISDSHMNLQIGQTYYGQPDGSVSTDSTGPPLGLAISESRMLFLGPSG